MKDLHIETLRGIAIILMVGGHVIGSNSSNGLRVSDDALWRYLYESLEFIRLPLFTVISGIVYSFRPVAGDGFKRFLKGKVRRLFIPLLVVGGGFYVTMALIPGTNKSPVLGEIGTIVIFPFAHYWYLQSLLIVFALVCVAERFGLFASDNRRYTSLSFAVIALLTFPTIEPNIFAVNDALYLLPFFIWGVHLHRSDSSLTTVSVILLIASVFVQQYLLYSGELLERNDASSVMAGLCGTYLLYRVRFSNKTLASLGAFSYAIYLYHVFGTAGSRVLLSQFGVHDTPTLFFVGLLGGLIPPIVWQIGCTKHRLSRLLFLGTR